MVCCGGFGLDFGCFFFRTLETEGVCRVGQGILFFKRLFCVGYLFRIFIYIIFFLGDVEGIRVRCRNFGKFYKGLMKFWISSLSSVQIVVVVVGYLLCVGVLCVVRIFSVIVVSRWVFIFIFFRFQLRKLRDGEIRGFVYLYSWAGLNWDLYLV